MKYKSIIIMFMLLSAITYWANTVKGEGETGGNNHNVSEDKYFQSLEETKKFCETLLGYFSKELYTAGFAEMKKKWPFPESEMLQLEQQTVRQLKFVRQRYGKPLSYLLVKSENIKDVIARFTYIIRCEKHILRVEFIFYNPDGKWMINNFKWDAAIGEVF